MSPSLHTSLALLSTLWLPICTQAHMQMSSPYPLRSPLDPNVPVDDKDYDMTNPLLSDGSNFPCKNYQNYTGGYVTKATYISGGIYDMWLNGTAEHDGGSCQLSLSYDNGVTFKVIKSIVGGCPLTHNYQFTIPDFAPASDSALLSWSWFNLIGNREMYQNCARVKIITAPGGRHRRASPYKRQSSSMDQFPDMFSCNIGNGCQTIERREVVFPDPGDDVVYGQDDITPDPGPGYVIAGASMTSISSTASSSATTLSASTTLLPPYPILNVTVVPLPWSTSTGVPGNNGTGNMTGSFSMTPTTALLTWTTTTFTASFSSSLSSLTFESSVVASRTLSEVASSTSMVYQTTSTTNTPTGLSSTFATSVTTTSSRVAPTTLLTSIRSTTTSAASAIATALPLTCVPGTFACNSPSSFSQCITSPSSPNGSTYVYMGSVAAGMTCVDDQIVRQNAGACTPNGQLFCNGERAFYLCDQGGLIDMGSVAPGTACRDGVIGYA